MKCLDGSYCNGVTDDAGWACCKNNGGRQKCPKNFPIMCANDNCAVDGTDYCCETKTKCKKYYGGIRQCNEKSKLVIQTSSF